ncbi:TetR family transcriptional regulator [Embleya sp. NBC_00896]|uniref:TetR family transcriptional regulator n=1 Tax=Embleya sp. NBC_00896 TaxID=2975961 RepID=UPI002F91AB8E|nr:TetR family transcriptional regulator [Embleya sp. NBC_00896]
MRRTVEEAAVTKSDVVDAALAVFAEYGYAAATIGSIAGRAGVTRGAVYHHFAGKADLYTRALEIRWDRVCGPIWAELDGAGPPLARLRAFGVAYLTAVENDGRFRELLHVTLFGAEALPELRQGLAAKERAMSTWVDTIAAVLTEARDAGALRVGREPRAAALAFVGLLTGVTSAWLTAPEVCSPAASAGSLVDALLDGIADAAGER